MFSTRKPRDVMLTALVLAGVAATVALAVVTAVHRISRDSAIPAAVAAPKPAPVPVPQNASILIQHVTRGCHSMTVNGHGPMVTRAVLHLTRGSTLRVTDDDVMPHTVVQLAGPAAQMTGVAMRHMGARSAVRFPRPGTYSLITRAGEDYTSGIKTVGADHNLRIKVVVAS